MTTVLAVDAVSNQAVDWHSINWSKAHREVRRLQVRTAKAIKEGKARKAKSLKASVHPQGKWKETSARHTNDERQSHASTLLAGP